MSRPDLNLLVALDVLLEEGSVASAARRLKLSPSAMSRTLSRLRESTGDPLLVRAGRGLAPTPRAIALRAHVGRVVQDAEAVLRPAQAVELATLSRSFTIRTREGFVETFGPALLARVRRDAPGVRVRFVQKLDKSSGPLREGEVDLETGVVGKIAGPELRAQTLFRDKHIGVVRPNHALSRGRVTLARFAKGKHVAVSRRGVDQGPIDEALQKLGIERDISVIVGSFSTAISLARTSDLIAVVPERHTEALRAGVHRFTLPIELPEIAISLIWHPRLDADEAHRWLRRCMREVCGARVG